MQPATSTDAIIADSISSLRLKPKGGAEVFLLDEENTSVEKIYKDLKASYIRVAEMLKVEPIYFKALEQLTMRVMSPAPPLSTRDCGSTNGYGCTHHPAGVP